MTCLFEQTTLNLHNANGARVHAATQSQQSARARCAAFAGRMSAGFIGCESNYFNEKRTRGSRRKMHKSGQLFLFTDTYKPGCKLPFLFHSLSLEDERKHQQKNVVCLRMTSLLSPLSLCPFFFSRIVSPDDVRFCDTQRKRGSLVRNVAEGYKRCMKPFMGDWSLDIFLMGCGCNNMSCGPWRTGRLLSEHPLVYTVCRQVCKY